MSAEVEEGPKLDFKDVSNGPISSANRQCRDIICAILLVINIIAMIAIAIYSYINSNQSQAYRATDNNLNVCGGQSTPTASYPYTYFFNPSTGDLSKRVCVQACPSYGKSTIMQVISPFMIGNAMTSIVNSTLSTLQCYTTPAVPSCSYDVIVYQNGSFNATPTSSSLIGYDSIEQIGTRQTQSIGRLCLPTLTVLNNAFSPYSTTLSDGVRSGYLADFITDLQNNWRWLLLSLVFAVVISVIYMVLLRFLAGCVVWLSLFGVLIVVIGCGFIFLFNGGAISSTYAGYLAIPTLTPSSYYNTYGYICFGIAAVLLIVILCCCSRLRLAVAICNVAGQFVARVLQVLLVPVILTGLVFALWVGSVIVMIGLVSSAGFITRSGDIFTSLASYSDNHLVMLYYYFFAVLWSNAFISALSMFVVASCCCMWYYTRGPGVTLDSPVLTSFWMAFRFHYGSLAFGSLILALIQFIQAIFQIFKSYADKHQAGDNICFQCMMKCVTCCLQCFKRLIEFLNRTAYIQIALRGKSFCGATFDAFQIIVANGLRYMIVSGVGQIMMFLGNICV